MRRSQSEFLPSAWSAQAEIPHPHGNAQIDSLSYPGGRRETGTIDLRPRSLSGAEPEGARDRMSAWASRLRGRFRGNRPMARRLNCAVSSSISARNLERNCSAKFSIVRRRSYMAINDTLHLKVVTSGPNAASELHFE